MPIILNKVYSISGNYTDAEKAILSELIDGFRMLISDDEPEKYILRDKTAYYSDNKIVQYLNMAARDVNNTGEPRTKYSLFEFHNLYMDMDIIQGAMLFACMSEGFMQLANQVDFSDSGLSIAMFNKSQLYQSWYGVMAQEYIASKERFKQTIIPQSANSGFIGIGSEFGYRVFK